MSACVAPLAGARIETGFREPKPNRNPVAPLAGARIETEHGADVVIRFVVAPLAGARIETAPARQNPAR